MDAAELLARAHAARADGDVGTMRTALIAAFDAARAVGDEAAMADAALAMPAIQRFGVHPGQIPALLHEAYVTNVDTGRRCRLAAALARSWVYGGNATRAARFADDALALAGEVGTADAMADALEAALVAHWGPDDFADRVSLAARLDDVAAHLTDPELRMAAHLWRLTTAWECLDAVAIQRQLRALDILADETGSERVAFYAASRRAMHAITVDGLDRADPWIDRTNELGARVAEPDVEAVVHSLAAARALVTADIVALRNEAVAHEAFGTAEGIPSVASDGAVLWLAAGDIDRAADLTIRLTSGGIDSIARDVDFLLVVTSLVEVASAVGLHDIAADGAAALTPYAGRGVLNAGAVSFRGVVDDYLYRAAVATGSGDSDRWRHAAEHAYRRIGARWWEQRLPGPSRRTASVATSTMVFRPDGDSHWLLGQETAPLRLADRKGLHYLRYLIDRPGVDVDALALSSAALGQGDATVEQSDAGEVLDAAARVAYQRRLRQLDGELDDADRRGDAASAERLTAERDALLRELRAAAGLGGRVRRTGGSAERARVAVRKAIAAALDDIRDHDAALGRLLRDSIRTGASCRYEPDPNRPVTWRTS